MRLDVHIVLLLSVVQLVSSSCWFSHGPCIDGNKEYNVGDRWRLKYDDHCEDCSCVKSGFACCSIPYPVDIPKSCAAIFDDKKCKYHVVRRDKPCIPCSRPVSYVGK
ncbi:beta-microseminoprotein-like [Anneissia japonica]|uniref:beta-microseminoprotein-like n=1 Tax=Anneissia japonica TaxID=1529436 RepID=UPI0014258DE9|nr:beta-microseminoprotein-like [Anneissia japonica]